MIDWNNFQIKLVECVSEYSRINNCSDFKKSISDNIKKNSVLQFDKCIANLSLIIFQHTGCNDSLFLNKEFIDKFNSLFIDFGLIDQDNNLITTHDQEIDYYVPNVRNYIFTTEIDYYESSNESDNEIVEDVCDDCDRYLKGGGTCIMCSRQERIRMARS